MNGYQRPSGPWRIWIPLNVSVTIPAAAVEFRRHYVAGDPPGSFLHALVGERGGADSSVHSGGTAVPECEQEPPDVGLG